jgi:hypothetical protein
MIMRRFLTMAALALVVVGTPARGALVLNIDTGGGGVCLAPGEVKYLEVYFDEVPPAEDERLILYAIGLRIPTNTGLIFGPGSLVGKTVEHPFVLPEDSTVDVLRATEHEIGAFVEQPLSLLNGVDIRDGAGVLRFPVMLRPGAVFGPAVVTFDLAPGRTEFANEVGELIPFVPTTGSFTICPDPSFAGVVLFGAGLAALRRNRRRV